MEIVAAQGLLPTTLDEALKLSEVLSKSNIVPKDLQGKPNDIFVALNWGIEIGLAPMQALQNIAVINGRPSVWGDAALALVRGSGKLEYIKESQTDTEAKCVIKRKEEPEATYTFTIQDANRAGLINRSPVWKAYPKRMMQMRARSFALRDIFTDVLKGVGIAEEEQDKTPDAEIVAPEEVAEPIDPLAPPTEEEVTDIEEVPEEVPGPQPGITVADINKLYKSAAAELKPKVLEVLTEGWRDSTPAQLAEYHDTIMELLL